MAFNLPFLNKKYLYHISMIIPPFLSRFSVTLFLTFLVIVQPEEIKSTSIIKQHNHTLQQSLEINGIKSENVTSLQMNSKEQLDEYHLIL